VGRFNPPHPFSCIERDHVAQAMGTKGQKGPAIRSQVQRALKNWPVFSLSDSGLNSDDSTKTVRCFFDYQENRMFWCPGNG
jgi:hypothetical protein